MNPKTATLGGFVARDIILDTALSRMIVEDIPDRPGSAAELFQALAAAEIVVDTVVENVSRQGATTLTFTLLENDRHKAYEVVQRKFREIGGGRVMTHGPIAKISVAGSGVNTHGGIAARFFGALAEAGINIEMIGNSESAISVVVSVDAAPKALAAVQKAFPAQQVS